MIQNAIRTLRTLLPRNGAVSQEEIDIQVDFVLSIPQYSAIERDTLVREIQSIYNIRMDDFRIIESQERRRPWINERRTEIWRQGQTSFWSRYQDYLEIEKN
jgi:hypothetical protein